MEHKWEKEKRIEREKSILKYSDPLEASRKTKLYLGPNAQLFFSTRKDKKYMVQTPQGHWVHFGAMGYEDFTKHLDEKRRQDYLKRSTNIKGNWKADKYSPNNLAIHILW
jgi:hypothetical protein